MHFNIFNLFTALQGGNGINFYILILWIYFQAQQLYSLQNGFSNKHFQEAAALMIWKGMTVSKPLHLSSVPVEATSISNWLSLNTF